MPVFVRTSSWCWLLGGLLAGKQQAVGSDVALHNAMFFPWCTWCTEHVSCVLELAILCNRQDPVDINSGSIASLPEDSQHNCLAGNKPGNLHEREDIQVCLYWWWKECTLL